jgi:RNA polymerase sigma factor (sigma-70 family)
MQVYFKDIRHSKTLSRDEEVILSKEIKEGNQKSLKKLIESNLKLVVTIANKYNNLGMDISDVVQEGNIGLMEAAKRFDSSYGKFSTYAGWWIRQSILLALSQKTRHIRLPMNVINEMRSHLGRFDMENITSLDSEVSEEDERTPLNFIQADCEMIKEENKEHLRHVIERAMKHMNIREREIVLFHFGIDKEYELSRDDIAERFGITRTRVNQIIKSSLAVMKREIVNF